MIKEMLLNEKEAEKLFNENCIYLYGDDAIPFYKMEEIFGEWVKDVINEMVHQNLGGYNACGDCSRQNPLVYYLDRGGFKKVVSKHNYRIIKREVGTKGDWFDE